METNLIFKIRHASTLFPSGSYTARGPYVVQTYLELKEIIVVLFNNFVRRCIVNAKYRNVKNKDKEVIRCNTAHTADISRISAGNVS